MRILTIALLSFVLLACQSESETNKPNATEEKQAPTATATPKKSDDHAGDDHSGHAHAQTDQPIFSELEVQDQCAQPTVIEFFAYQCPHCYKLEEHAKKWLANKADDVLFISVPTDLGRQEFTQFVAAHYVAERLGVLEQIKPLLFGVIHEGKQINNILEAFVEAGADKAEVEKAFQDVDYIKKRFDEGFELMKRYKVSSVPSVLVNYQYMTDVSKAGGYDKVFNVVDETLAKPAKCTDFSKP